MIRKTIVGAALLCIAAVAVQYANHATQRNAVGRVVSGRLLDLNLVGGESFREALAADLRGLDLDLDGESDRLTVRRSGDTLDVEVAWVRQVTLGPFQWEHPLSVARSTVDLGI